MCPGDALGLVIGIGWILLIVALAVGALAFLAIVTRPAWAAVEGPIGRFVGRHVRAQHGIALDAPHWACRACHSVNEAMAVSCYACGAAACEAGEPILPASAEETWRPLVPPSRFDPSRYRGPGAPGPGDGVAQPPAEEQRVDEPPADEPPADEPPADVPPADVPPADEPPPGPTIGP